MHRLGVGELADLERLVEPVSRGDPESALRWTAKSLRRLAEELRVQGHSTNRQTVADLLHGLGYSLQANTKTREGGRHPDRNAQFEHIHRRVQAQLAAQAPAISVDTKKKELVGNFKNGGLEWRPKGEPEEVRAEEGLAHDHFTSSRLLRSFAGTSASEAFCESWSARM